MTRIVLIGPPACGKGTQASRLAELLSIPAISTGDLYRAEIALQTPVGREVQALISEGQLAPDVMTLSLIERRIRQTDAAPGFILDGSPRTTLQVEMLDTLLERHATPIDHAFLIEVPLDEVLRRMAQRRETMLAKGETPRPDDQPDSLRVRYGVFESQTLPAARLYEERGLLTRVDGRNGRDETFEAIRAVL